MLSANSNSDPDNLSITLSFSDGSLGTIIYTSVGDPSFSKERLEVFGNNQVGVIENWRSLKIQGNGKKISKNSLIETKKGFDEEIKSQEDVYPYIRRWLYGDREWKVEYEAKMRYNRCIFYEADILHSQNMEIGMFDSHDRINQIFFL